MTATPSANGVPPAAERLLHLVEPVESKVDSAAAEAAIHDLLVALGHDPESDHLRDTPRRVVTRIMSPGWINRSELRCGCGCVRFPVVT